MQKWTSLAVLALFLIALPVLAIERSEIPDDYKWNPEHIYPTMEDWEEDFTDVQAGLEELASFKGQFAGPDAENVPQKLIEFNANAKDIEIKFSHLYSYVMYNFHVDMANPEWMGKLQQLQFLGLQYGEKLAWVEPEMIQIPEEKLLGWCDEYEELAPHKKGYEDMYALQEHVLSESEEQIMALSGNMAGAAGDARTKLADVDMPWDMIEIEGEEVKANDAGWNGWRYNQDRDVRERYFNAVWSKYRQFGHVFAATMAGNLKEDIFYAKARKYESTLEAALAPNFIPVDVYMNLVNTTRANTAPLHKYNQIRKRMLGVEHYRHWDYYVPLIEADETRYTWEEGVEMVLDAIKPLGKEYIKMVDTGLAAESGWVDVFANDGKRGGAYSSSCYGIHPYMLFNFDYEKGLTLEDVSTMAHEMGHSMHTYLSEMSQPFPTRSYAIFNAEVASTVNEVLMGEKMLEMARKEYQKAKGDKKEAARDKLVYLLQTSINSCRGTFFRQTMFATWELEAHKMAWQGQPMTVESFDKLYADLLAEFHGPAAEYEELSAVSWARIPHFYRGFYVYSYATSYAAAVALAQNIQAEYDGDKSQKGATKKYMAYLASGSSKHPVELLKDAGVDMTTAAPIEAFIEYFESLVNELDELTKE